jgi:gliding motility-associated-like protein
MHLKVFFCFTVFTVLRFISCGEAYAQANQTVTNGTIVPAVSLGGACSYNWVNSNPAIGLAAAGTGDILSFKATNNGSSPITANITATSVNQAFAYILHPSTNQVSVMNMQSNSVVSIINVGRSPQLIAINASQTKAYVINAVDNSISVINTSTNAVDNTFTIPSTLPNNAYTSIIVTQDETRLIISLGAFICVLDALTGHPVVTVGSKGQNIAATLAKDGSTMYSAGSLDIGVFDVKTLSVTQRDTPKYPGATFGAPNVLASVDGKHLYAMGLKFSQTPSVWVLNLTDLEPAKLITPASIISSGMVAESPDASLIYVCTQDQNSIYITVLNTITGNTMANIPIKGYPSGMSLSADGTRLYIESNIDAALTVIDTQLQAIVATIPLVAPSSCIGYFVIGSNCPSINYTLTVDPDPVISTAGNLTALSTVYGTPSASSSFTLSSNYPAANIAITPPNGFEVGTDNVSFNPTVTVSGNGTVVYVRLAKTTFAGTYSGSITLNSGNAGTVISQPNSTVTPATLTVTANNKTVVYGQPIPLLTATYKGFVNNDSIKQLTIPPIITTTATVHSTYGQYPIMVSGAASLNYTFTYNPGVLTVVPSSAFVIPNTFTPNGDGINDTWNIPELNSYPDITVQVFNRNGQIVYYSRNYTKPWDGTYKNGQLPFGTYYYVINLGSVQGVLTGHITIVR